MGQQSVCNVLKQEKRHISVLDVSEKIGISRRSARRNLRKLWKNYDNVKRKIKKTNNRGRDSHLYWVEE